MLDPLSDNAVAGAVEMLRSSYSKPEIAEAARRAGGSVKEALRLLQGESRQFDTELDAVLTRLPYVDWREIHALADAVAGRENEIAYETLIAKLLAFLDRAVREGSALGPARLQPYAEAWEKILDAARETEVLNLDKRPLILSIFADLADAVQASRQASAHETV